MNMTKALQLHTNNKPVEAEFQNGSMLLNLKGQ
jgi:hypothetical protein